MIQIEDLSITTNTLLMKGVTVNLVRGKIYGVSAPNGSGKSTFMRTIADLRPVEKGKIVFYKDDKQEIPLSGTSLKKELFYFENSSWLDGNLTGLDYLELINKLWQGEKQLIEDVISLWDLSDYIKKPIKKYSLGMKQKILLSLYYVSDTNYWFLDEPTLGLDRKSLLLLEKYLLSAKEDGKMIFFVSHTGDNLFAICHEVFTIEDLELVALGGGKNVKLLENFI